MKTCAVCGGEIPPSRQAYANTCCGEHGRALALKREPRVPLIKKPVKFPAKRKPARKPRYIGGNPTKQSSQNSSKYRGVKKHYKSWRATCANVCAYYGPDEFLAAIAYDREALRLYGPRATLNYRVT